MTSKDVQVTEEQAIELAQRHREAGNFLVASRIYQDILETFPDHFQSLQGLALISYARRDFKDARQWFEKALKVNKADDACWNNYGVVLDEMGLVDEAHKAWNKAIKACDWAPEGYNNKAYSYWKQRNYRQAEKYAKIAVEKKPDHAHAWLNLGNVQYSRGKEKEACESWEKAVQHDPLLVEPYSNLGNFYRERGDLDKGESYLKKALECNPNHVHALNNLGCLLRDQGRTADAETYFHQAVSLQPNYALAHFNLAICQAEAMKLREAAASCRYALTFQPDQPEVHLQLGTVLRELGQVEDAEFEVRRAMTLNPGLAGAYYELADLLFMRDRLREAEEVLEQALKIEANSARVFIRQADLLELTGRYDEALEAVEKAMAANDRFPRVYTKKAMLYTMLDNLEEAEKVISEAIEAFPKVATFYAIKADILQTGGRMKESEEFIEKGMKLNARLPSFYSFLRNIRSYEPDHEDTKRVLELEKVAHQYPLHSRAVLHFALFGVYEDLKDYDKAFYHLQEGNRTKRMMVPYNPEYIVAQRNSIKKYYNKKFFPKFEGKNHDSERPVFILGMPRSGTTLTEQILSSHPEVFGAGELNALPEAEREIGLVTPDNAREFGEYYLDLVRKRDKTEGKARFVTDKLPANFIRIGLIASVFPNAKIIHCRRDPIDTCFSCYKQNFAFGQYWSYDLQELADEYARYQDMMDHWRKVLPGGFYEITYEDTVNNFEEQARKLIDYVGLPWDDACLQPHKKKRAVLTASKAQVVKPVYKTSVKSWQRYEEQLQPLIKGLEA